MQKLVCHGEGQWRTSWHVKTVQKIDDVVNEINQLVVRCTKFNDKTLNQSNPLDPRVKRFPPINKESGQPGG